MPAVLFLGAVLGVASAFEEARGGFDIGISSDGLWLAFAFACGARARSWSSALVRGVAGLTAANLAYYAVGGGAPSPGLWLALGLGGGLVFGAAGRLWRAGSPAVRVAAVFALAGVLVVEGSEVFSSDGEVDDGVELAIGCALPVVTAQGARLRLLAAGATAALVAVAATGALDPLVP
jgi:hypothetical protein